jgi:Fe2+ or Zn2+ uptake regulation protein
MREPVERTLASHGIQPSSQRVAVARYVLSTDAHPSADRVLEEVRAREPLISRATVYNTLNLFVRKGLLRQHVLGGRVVFDPNVARHHHFIDEETGTIHDVPWEALDVRQLAPLPGAEIRELHVVLRGRWRSPGRRRARREAARPDAPPAAVERPRRGAQLERMSEHDRKPSENEGEGSRSAARQYNEGAERTVRRGQVDEDAEKARRDVDANPGEYRTAEEEGKRRSAGEAPGDVEK